MARYTPQRLCVFSGPFREAPSMEIWIYANLYLGSGKIIKAMPLRGMFNSYKANNLVMYNLHYYKGFKRNQYKAGYIYLLACSAYLQYFAAKTI